MKTKYATFFYPCINRSTYSLSGAAINVPSGVGFNILKDVTKAKHRRVLVSTIYEKKTLFAWIDWDDINQN